MTDDEQRPRGGAPWMRPPSIPGAPGPGAAPPPEGQPAPAPAAPGQEPAPSGAPGGPPPTFVSPSAAVLGGRSGFGGPGAGGPTPSSAGPAGPGGPTGWGPGGGAPVAGGGGTGGGGGDRGFADLLGAHHDEEPGERPVPSIGGAAAAAAGALVVFGLFAILSDAKGDNVRATGIFLSLIWELGGIVLLLFTHARRAVAGAVAITAVTVLPLVTYLLVDVDHPLNTFDSPDSFRNVQMQILALSLVIWLGLYLVGPGRRHGFYLGAALYALWSLPITYISASAFSDTLSSLDVAGIDGSDGSGSGLFDNPKTTLLALGLVSIAFGLAYLAIGMLLDRADDNRRGTPFFALAPFVLGSGLAYLSGRYGLNWIASLGFLLGVAEVSAGVLGRRRFTTWIGGIAMAGGVIAFVGNNIDHAVPAGVTLTIVGLVVIVALAITEGAVGWGPTRRVSGAPDGPGLPGAPMGGLPMGGVPMPGAPVGGGPVGGAPVVGDDDAWVPPTPPPPSPPVAGP